MEDKIWIKSCFMCFQMTVLWILHSTSMDMNSVFHYTPTVLLYETISCSIILFQVKEHSWLMMKIPSQGGMGFLIEPDCVNTYFADRKDPWEYAWIEFSGLRAKEILEGSGLSSDSPVYLPRTPQDGERLKNEILYLATHSQESSYHLIGHLYLIMDALVSGSSSRRRTQGGKRAQFYTNEAVTFIAQNYSRAITVEDMARRCNLDRSYFGKVFRDVLGQSPQEFLIQYRMEKAAELLKITDLSVGEISRQVGYPNQLHFSRAFKNFYGISPRTYRQNNKFL